MRRGSGATSGGGTGFLASAMVNFTSAQKVSQAARSSAGTAIRATPGRTDDKAGSTSQ